MSEAEEIMQHLRASYEALTGREPDLAAMILLHVARDRMQKGQLIGLYLMPSGIVHLHLFRNPQSAAA